jgi:hypothetical protein
MRPNMDLAWLIWISTSSFHSSCYSDSKVFTNVGEFDV